MPPRLSALAVACIATVAGSGLAVPAHGAAPDPLLQKINSLRARHDLPALRESRRLSGRATRHAHHMLRTDTMAHTSRAAGFHSFGETLALQRGLRPRPSKAIRIWLNSPLHRSLVLSRSFRVMGAGSASGRFRRLNATVWVAEFAR